MAQGCLFQSESAEGDLGSKVLGLGGRLPVALGATSKKSLERGTCRSNPCKKRPRTGTPTEGRRAGGRGRQEASSIACAYKSWGFPKIGDPSVVSEIVSFL